VPVADNAGCQAEERFVDVVAALPTNASRFMPWYQAIVRSTTLCVPRYSWM